MDNVNQLRYIIIMLGFKMHKYYYIQYCQLLDKHNHLYIHLYIFYLMNINMNFHIIRHNIILKYINHHNFQHIQLDFLKFNINNLFIHNSQL